MIMIMIMIYCNKFKLNAFFNKKNHHCNILIKIINFIIRLKYNLLYNNNFKKVLIKSLSQNYLSIYDNTTG